jgi:hypothetical protein
VSKSLVIADRALKACTCDAAPFFVGWTKPSGTLPSAASMLPQAAVVVLVLVLVVLVVVVVVVVVAGEGAGALSWWAAAKPTSTGPLRAAARIAGAACRDGCGVHASRSAEVSGRVGDVGTL